MGHGRFSSVGSSFYAGDGRASIANPPRLLSHHQAAHLWCVDQPRRRRRQDQLALVQDPGVIGLGQREAGVLFGDQNGGARRLQGPRAAAMSPSTRGARPSEGSSKSVIAGRRRAPGQSPAFVVRRRTGARRWFPGAAPGPEIGRGSHQPLAPRGGRLRLAAARVSATVIAGNKWRPRDKTEPQARRWAGASVMSTPASTIGRR